MKFKTTRKAVMDGYCKVIQVGYCDAPYLLSPISPNAYTCGVYGWNADIYELSDAVAVCTGYRPFGNVKPDYDTVHAFEQRAREICHNPEVVEKVPPLENLLDEFVKACSN